MGIFGSIFGGGKSAIGSTAEAEAMLKADSAQRHSPAGGMSFRVDGSYMIMGVGVVIAGEVISGEIVCGDRCEQNGKSYVAKSLEAQHKSIPRASVGEKIGILMGDAKASEEFHPGDILNFHK